MQTKLRKNLYFSETTVSYLETKDNYSEYVQNLILRDMNDKSEYLKKKEDLLQERKQIQIREAEIDSELLVVDKELARIDKMENNRPAKYDDVVDVLLHLKGGVTKTDLVNQAKELNVELGLLKMWLFDDGVYDKLLLR